MARGTAAQRSDEPAGAGHNGPELADKDHRAIGKRVLTTLGDDIGKLKDADFDPDNGVLTMLHMENMARINSSRVSPGAKIVFARLSTVVSAWT